MARLYDLTEESMATTSSPTIGLGFVSLLAIRVVLLKPTKVIAGSKDKKK
jgi:hypothetical protein